MSRLAELVRRHSGIPVSILLKTDVLFSGLRVNADLLEAGRTAMPGFRPVIVDGVPHPIPYFLRLPDRDRPDVEMLALVRPNPQSPYALVKRPDGHYWITDGERQVSRVKVEPKPAWRSWAEQNGLARAATAMDAHGDMLVANLTPACEYWPVEGDAGCRCRFCGYGAISRRSQALGQKRGVHSADPQTLDEFRRILAKARPETSHLYLVGGSMLDREAEGARYLEITGAAVEADPAYRGIIACGSQALPRLWLQRIHEAGAGYVCFNLEVWDAAQWEKLCPGKARHIGRDAWLQSLVDAVEIFGRGAVFSAFVTGAELVPPFGFATEAMAVESNIEGAEWMISRGIVPIYSVFSPSPTSEYEKATAPGLDYFLRLNVETARLRARHNLHVDNRFICSGCAYAQLECDFDRV